MKELIFTLSILFVCTLVSAQSIWSKVSIDQEITYTELIETGIPAEVAVFDKETGRFTMEISELDIEKLDASGIEYTVVIADLEKFYAKRLEIPATDPISSKDWDVPANFTYGSMGGYLTLEEIMYHLDNMQEKFPELINVRQPISDLTTVEGRSIYYVRISDNPEVNEDEPEVLYTGLHHAREPAGLMHLIYYMYYLLENYDTDEDIQRLVNSTEMYFIPCVNPDGYEYNRTTNPDGGGMWRKNRVDNGDGEWGVDLNRNYGYMWGLDNNGSSPNTSDLTYRGTAPFSELETQMMKEFCENNEFLTALNYHTYSNLLLGPWGYTEEQCEDHDLLMTYLAMMTAENNYTYGPGSTTIYPTNGGSDDWMYGEQETKGKIMAFTPEVGGSNDGFWPTQNRIIPLCQENMLQSMLAAEFAGDYVLLEDVANNIIGETNLFIQFKAQQIGLTPKESYTISIIPTCDDIIEVGEPLVFSAEELHVEVLDSIAMILDPNIQQGTIITYQFAVDNGENTRYFNSAKIAGQITNIVDEQCNTLDNWSGTIWSLTTSDYISAPASITDSPNGAYGNNVNSEIIFNYPVDLSNAIYAQISFMAKWDIEADYDYVEFMVSSNGGSTWIPMEGLYTNPGTNDQDPGMPLYDGQQNEWVKEVINLESVLGNEVQIKFKFHSDTYVDGDGFYFDDLSLDIISTSVGIDDKTEGKIIVSPVPAKDHIFITNLNDNPISHITLYDLNGRKIKDQNISSSESVIYHLEHYNAGIYILNVQFTDGMTETKKIIIE